jgi:hypothetical protein
MLDVILNDNRNVTTMSDLFQFEEVLEKGWYEVNQGTRNIVQLHVSSTSSYGRPTVTDQPLALIQSNLE